MYRSIVYFALFCLVGPGLGANAQPPEIFDSPWRAYDIADFPGFAPLTMAAGDIDSDGDPDVVATRQHFFQPGIAILKNNGDGGFSEEILYDLPTQLVTEELALVDFDGDFDLDVIATIPGNSSSDFRLAVWRNDGSGEFAAHELYMVGRGPLGITIADFNGDGFPDVAVAADGYWSGTDHSVAVLFHNGLSGAAAEFDNEWTEYDLGNNGREIYASDFDDDGDQDLVVTLVNINGFNGIEMALLLNDGTGQFLEGARYDNGGWDMAVADVNVDGHADLILAGLPNNDYGLTIRLNDGDGNFNSIQTFNLPANSPRIRAIATTDLDGDDDLDILATTPSGRSGEGWLTYVNNGMGQFSEGQKYESSKWTMDIVGCDIDNDGDNDVMTIAQDASVLTVHRNPGDGQFLILPRLQSDGFLVKESTTGDVNGDGVADLAYWYGRDIQIVDNDGSGLLSNGDAIDLGFETPQDMKLADMNADGLDDVVVVVFDAIKIFLNQGGGNFTTSNDTPFSPGGVDDLSVGDLNNDGAIDVVIAGGESVSIFSNDGMGNLIFSGTVDSPEPIRSMQLADITNDGILDLFTMQSFSGMGVFTGNGNFTFANEPVLTGEFPAYWGLGDANGDEILDVLMVMPQDSFGLVNVAVSLGYGDGAFQFRTEFPGPNGREGAFLITRSCSVADINQDGRDDLITTNNAPNDVSVFLSDVNGDLLPQNRYGTGYSPTATSIVDFTGDGLPDVATLISLPPSGFEQSVVLLKNILDLKPDCLLADINGDQNVDLLDVQPFVDQLNLGQFSCEADMNQDGAVNLLDVAGFVSALSGS